MTRRLLLAPLALLLCLAVPTSSLAADTPLKVAVVDLQKAIRTVPDGKAAKAKLEGTAKKRQGELDKRQNSLKKMKEDLEKQASLLKEAVKRQKFREFQAKLYELQEAFMQHQAELKKQEAKLLQPIFEKMEKTIEKLAKEKGYTLVLEKGESRVLFHAPALDITDMVIQRYGK